MSKTPLQVYLTARDRQLLEQLAGREGLSLAETVREAVRRWAMEDAESGGDPVLGLIGSIDDEDLPRDLSTGHDAYAVRGYRGAEDQEPERLDPGRRGRRAG
jgi:hypothetical protein